MIFTTTQLMILFIVTEVLIWDIFRIILGTIRYCSAAKAYRYAVFSGTITPNDCKEWIEKECKNKEEN